MSARARASFGTLAEFLQFHAGKIEQRGDCLVWTGCLDPRGYGRVGTFVDGRKAVRFTHRIAYALVNGAIPDRTDVDHICHNPACLNPEHLRDASHQENLRHRRGAESRSLSGVRGVRFRPDGQKWEARLFVNGKEVRLGRFLTMETARDAVVAARSEHYGEFAGGA